MAIKFSGEFDVKRKPEEVYDFLTDPNRFAPLLPDFQSVSVQDPTHFTVRVNVGISCIKVVSPFRALPVCPCPDHQRGYLGCGSVAWCCVHDNRQGSGRPDQPFIEMAPGRGQKIR